MFLSKNTKVVLKVIIKDKHHQNLITSQTYRQTHTHTDRTKNNTSFHHFVACRAKKTNVQPEANTLMVTGNVSHQIFSEDKCNWDEKASFISGCVICLIIT